MIGDLKAGKLLEEFGGADANRLEQKIRKYSTTVIPLAGVMPVTSVAEFKQEIAANKLTVVDFSTTWCSWCQYIAPKFEEFAANYTQAAFLKVFVS